jgi:hypothetical protein
MAKTFSFFLLHLGLLPLGHGHDIGAHGGQQLQGKGKAVFALVDAVDEHLDVNIHALGLQPTGELLVRELLALAKVFDDGLGSRLVELVRSHRLRAYMVFDLCASYFSTFPLNLNKSFSIYT